MVASFSIGMLVLSSVITTVGADTTTTTTTTTSETTTTTTSATTTTTTPAPTCGLTVTSPNPDFLTLKPNQVSSEQIVTIQNTGTSPTSTLIIEGTDWGAGFPVGQTHWALTTFTYGTGDNALMLSPGGSLGTSLSGGASQDVHLEAQVPAGQAAAAYQQTITFTSGC